MTKTAAVKKIAAEKGLPVKDVPLFEKGDTVRFKSKYGPLEGAFDHFDTIPTVRDGVRAELLVAIVIAYPFGKEGGPVHCATEIAKLVLVSRAK